MQVYYYLRLLAIGFLSLASSAPVNNMSPFLKSMIGTKAIRSGDIPLYSTKPAHVIQTTLMTKRDTKSSDVLHYMIQTTDDILNITLHPNRKLLSRNFMVQKRTQNGSLENMDVPARNCYYTGSVVGRLFSRVAMSMCDGEMKGIIECDDDVFVMEPSENHSHVAHKMKREPMKFEDGNALPCPTYKVENGWSNFTRTFVHHKCRFGYQIFGSNFRKCLPYGEWSGNTPICVRNGALKKEDIQVLQCPELPNPEWGTVNITQNARGLFVAVYKCMLQRSISGDKLRFCSPTSGQWSGSAPRCLPTALMDAYMNGLSMPKEESDARKKRQSSATTTIELMVYVDSGVQNDVEQNGLPIVEYILGIINIMARMYHDATLQHQIDLTLTRLILEGVDVAASINIQQDFSSALNTFCAYQRSVNVADDSDPLHFDHAILITSVDLCSNSGGCSNTTGFLGAASVGGMCSSTSSCTINENYGFGTASTMAHETGHNLGMQHDGIGNVCVSSNTIMTPSLGRRDQWSSCSAEYLQAFLNSGSGACLEDVPAQGEFEVDPTQLVGTVFNLDEQCQAQHGPNATFCPFEIAIDQICSSLWCQTNGGSCTTYNIPPTDGTSCGSGTNICIQGECVDGSIMDTPVDGGWSKFGLYGSCSRTCGGGVRYRERQCNNPAPEFGGSFCAGNTREYDPQLCNTNECPQGSASFINQQCAATNDVPYNGFLHTWEEITENVPGVRPCELICRSVEQGNFALRQAVVQDGTPCYVYNLNALDSSNSICVQGACTPVGCDNVLESGVQSDSCGVCNGDNSGATLMLDILTGSGGFGYHTVATIPAGARNVRIADVGTTSRVFIALESQGQPVLNNGLRVRGALSFRAIGSAFQYIRISDEESVSTRGPLQQPLTVQALLVETGDYTFTVEYAICA